MSYLDFDIEIDRAASGYRIEVNSPAGQSSGLFQPPFSDLELENFLLKLGQSRRTMRRIDTPETEAAKAFGARLFDAVFVGDVRACLRSSLDEASRQGKGLRIRLRLTDAPELADLPWEYLYHSALNRFLALSVNTPIVRYLELPERITPLAIEPPLRVLALIASPRDMPALNTEREWQRLNEALGVLIERGLVTLERVEQPSLLGLQQRLRRSRYHILHFIGHGGFDTRSQDGELLLEDPDGSGYRISGQDLGMLLHDHRSLRLVVLNACEGARASRTDPFAGAAQSLVQQGLPAVIAMQFEVSDEAAIALARDFYGALADGYPVDAALSEARKTLFASGSGVEWGTPVLYLRAPDGRIFSVLGPPAPPATTSTTRRTLLPEPPLPPASDERVLDAALPEQVVVNQTIELVTQIRRADAPGLRALLGQPGADFEARPDNVRSSTFTADFPRNALGQPQPLDLLLAIESTDFSTATPRQHIRLSPNADSEPVVFLLTPLHAGELRLLIRVYLADNVLLASGFLKISGISQLAEGLRPLKRLLSLSLGTFGIGTEHMGAIGLPATAGDSGQGEPKSADEPRPRPTKPIDQGKEAKPTINDAEPEPAETHASNAVRPPGRMPWLSWAAPLITVLVIALVAGAVYQRVSVSSNPSPTAEPVATSLPAQMTEAPATAEPSAMPAPTAVPAPTAAPQATFAPEPTNIPEPTVAPTAAQQPTAGLTPANFAGWHELRKIETSAVVNGVAFSPDGETLAAARADRLLLLWRVADGTVIARLNTNLPQGGRITAVAYSPDGILLAAARSDGAIVLWNAATRQQERLLVARDSRDPIQSIAFSHDGTLLASGSDDTRIRLWRIADGTLIRTFEGHSASVWGLAFAPNDQTLASGANESRPSSADTKVFLWNVADGTIARTFEGHTAGVMSVAFSPDGTRLAAGSWDETVLVWNVADGALRHRLEGHPRGASSVVFSNDGRVIATAAGDGNARLWDAASGRLLRALEGHTSWASSVAFSPSGALLASGSADETIRIWGN